MVSFCTVGKRGACPCAISISFRVWYAGFNASPSGRSMVRPPSERE
jgi:hypothetical protein